MLKKLLKYDLKYCYKTLIIFYILTLFFAGITRIFSAFDNSLIFVIISKICVGITISMIVNVIINTSMRVWARVIRNLYKDESYLIHTLPVSKKSIFTSKILTAIITTLTSFIVIVATLVVGFLSKENWQLLKIAMEQTAIFFNSSISSVVAILTVTVFFEFLFMVMAGILGILIGFKSNNLKVLKSIIFGFTLYTIPSLITVGVIGIMGLFNQNIMSVFTSVTIDTEVLKLIMYGVIAMYIIYDIIYYIIGNKLLNKGVNVD